MDCLHKAMTSGHLDATYAVGMILILKDSESKNNGMQMIYDLKKINCTKTKFEEIHQKVLQRLLWIKNTFIVGRKMPICCKNHNVKDSGWKDFKDLDLDCHHCCCDQEIVHLWKHLPQSV